MSRFDAMLEQKRAAVDKEGGPGEASGGEDGGGGSDGSAGSTGGTMGSYGSAGSAGGATDSSGSAGGMAGASPAGYGSGGGGGIPNAPHPVRQGSYAASGPIFPVPDDIPQASGDDMVAQQLREAAMKEPDPVLRKKLWNEYRRYKGLPLEE